MSDIDFEIKHVLYNKTLLEYYKESSKFTPKWISSLEYEIIICVSSTQTK
jgi:hypothetical protein